MAQAEIINLSPYTLKTNNPLLFVPPGAIRMIPAYPNQALMVQALSQTLQNFTGTAEVQVTWFFKDEPQAALGITGNAGSGLSVGTFITTIESSDGSVVVTDPQGPTVDLTGAGGGSVAPSVVSLDVTSLEPFQPNAAANCFLVVGPPTTNGVYRYVTIGPITGKEYFIPLITYVNYTVGANGGPIVPVPKAWYAVIDETGNSGALVPQNCLIITM